MKKVTGGIYRDGITTAKRHRMEKALMRLQDNRRRLQVSVLAQNGGPNDIQQRSLSRMDREIHTLEARI